MKGKVINMDSCNFKIRNILNTFHNSTDIEAIFFDTELNLIRSFSEKESSSYFSLFGISEISSYLKEIFLQTPITESVFYTYLLPNNFMLNVVFVVTNNSYIGAFASEPVSTKKLNTKSIEKLLNNSKLTLNDKKIFQSILLKIPVMHYDKIISMGEILYQLSKTIFEKKPRQILGNINMKYEI